MNKNKWIKIVFQMNNITTLKGEGMCVRERNTCGWVVELHEGSELDSHPRLPSRAVRELKLFDLHFFITRERRGNKMVSVVSSRWKKFFSNSESLIQEEKMEVFPVKKHHQIRSQENVHFISSKWKYFFLQRKQAGEPDYPWKPWDCFWSRNISTGK